MPWHSPQHPYPTAQPPSTLLSPFQGAIRCGMDALATCSRLLALRLGAGADTNTNTANATSGGTRTAAGVPGPSAGAEAGPGAAVEGLLGAPAVAWGEPSTSGARAGPGGGGAAAAARRAAAVIRTAVHSAAMLNCLAVDNLGRDQMGMVGAGWDGRVLVMRWIICGGTASGGLRGRATAQVRGRRYAVILCAEGSHADHTPQCYTSGSSTETCRGYRCIAGA